MKSNALRSNSRKKRKEIVSFLKGDVSENCLKVSEKSGKSQGIFNFLMSFLDCNQPVKL